MQKKESSKLLSVSTMAEEFGIKPALIYHWIRFRKFPIIKIDKKVLIPRADFETFLENHSIPGGEG